MRNRYLLYWLLILSPIFCRAQSPKLEDGYYSVVATFSSHHEDYAQKMVKKLATIGRSAKYGFDPNKNYWYVYTFQSADKEICRAETKKLQGEGPFSDAWIHTIGNGKSSDEIKIVEEVKETPKEEEHHDTHEETPEKSSNAPVAISTSQIVCALVNSTNSEIVEGDIEIVEPEKSKMLVRVKGNEPIKLPNPGNKSGKLLLISNVFGFRKEELEINAKMAEGDTLKPYIQYIDNHYQVTFDLVRIHKGDISTLYNVYFFNDAAVMLPTSQYQLNSLLKMLNENPTMKIILHGHTNGGGNGKIIYMGPSKNFFAITKDVKTGSGSAKELSNARAEVIRDWLVTQGIDSKRIEVKGWGGAKMIYDKDSQYARKNIRVDVEVAED